MPSDQTTSETDTASQMKPGNRVRAVGATKCRLGIFRHVGSNGLAQVMWDGNRHPAYIALSMIEPIQGASASDR